MESENNLSVFHKEYLPFHSALTNFCGTHAILYHGRNMKSLNIPYIYIYVFLRNVFPWAITMNIKLRILVYYMLSV